jgi:6-pyruvoyltetrahydropterin/6-carboxytetrahydropterin synthase
MYELSVEGHFAAAHSLREYEGECERLHGHNWRVVARVAADELDRLGMVVDFRRLKQALEEALAGLDHSYLNEVPPFDVRNPTTENICRHVADRLQGLVPEGVRVTRVACWESSECGAVYTP